MLTPLENDKNPLSRWGCYDIESIADGTFPVAIGCCFPSEDGLTYKSWNIQEYNNPLDEFLDFIKYRPNMVNKWYAHYGGKYDAPLLLEKLVKRKDHDFKIVDQNGKIIELGWKPEKHKISIRDSSTYLKSSLEDLTDTFGVKHEKLANVDRTKMDELLENDREKFDKYLKYDVLGLYEVLNSFFSILWDRFKTRPRLTLASTTMNVYRKQYLDRNLRQLRRSIEDDVRNAYHGGRTEVFQRHYEGEIFAYDVNSLYPYIYSTKEMPIGRPKSEYRHDENHESIVKVRAVVKDSVHVPIIPTKKRGKLLFPTGHFTTWCHSSELEKAKKYDQLENHQILEAYSWRTTNLFKDYGKDLYEMKKKAKKEGNDSMYLTSKLLMNSFYGKFGQSRDFSHFRWLSDQDTRLRLAKEKGISKYHKGLYEVFEEGQTSPFILPHIAVTITAKARLHLFELIKYLEDHEKHSVLYCDTDSVYSKIPIEDDELIDSITLGKLDNEYPDTTLKEGIFLAPKTYVVIDENGDAVTPKAKGIDRSITLNTEDYRKALDEKTVTLTDKEHLTAWKTPYKNDDGFISSQKFERSLPTEDSKRNHLSDNRSRPINL